MYWEPIRTNEPKDSSDYLKKLEFGPGRAIDPPVKCRDQLSINPNETTQVGLAEESRNRNQQLVTEFLGTLADLSDARISKYRAVLTKMARDLGKPLESVTKPELQDNLRHVNTRADYSDWTKLCYRQFAKKFFCWLRDPSFVDWVRLGSVWSKVDVEDLLTDNELLAMRRACDNLRDRALVETGSG